MTNKYKWMPWQNMYKVNMINIHSLILTIILILINIILTVIIVIIMKIYNSHLDPNCNKSIVDYKIKITMDI